MPSPCQPKSSPFPPASKPLRTFQERPPRAIRQNLTCSFTCITGLIRRPFHSGLAVEESEPDSQNHLFPPAIGRSKVRNPKHLPSPQKASILHNRLTFLDDRV